MCVLECYVGFVLQHFLADSSHVIELYSTIVFRREGSLEILIPHV